MLERQVVIPASPEQLWDALTEPESVAAWFGSEVQWDLRPAPSQLSVVARGPRRWQRCLAGDLHAGAGGRGNPADGDRATRRPPGRLRRGHRRLGDLVECVGQSVVPMLGRRRGQRRSPARRSLISPR
jgi:Activator of Hsp90 ATPase homolog 1-like protein